MGRLNGLTENGTPQATAAYGTAGEMLSKLCLEEIMGGRSNWAQAYDPATNRAVAGPGFAYDGNGNLVSTLYGPQNTSYDAENRIVSEYLDTTGNVNWGYDPSGKRVEQWHTDGSGAVSTWALYFYDIFGKPIETLTGDSQYPYTANTFTTNVYFGSRLVVSNGVAVVTDRLGSVRANANHETFSYLPYGEERTATASSRTKFGTYLRDSSAYNQDYADQRYYNPWYGRFNTADPAGLRAANLANPSSWNRYAYVEGDPVNYRDSTGLLQEGDVLEWAGDGGSGGGGGGFCIPQPIGETGIYFDCTNSSPVPDDPSTYQGSQGSGTVTAVNGLTHSAAIDATWAQIRGAFAAGSDCGNWFNAGLMTGTNHVYGSIDNFLGNVIPGLSGAGSFVGGSANAIATSPLTPGTLIAVNTNGAFFNALPPNTTLAPSDDFASQFANIKGNSDQARVFILLHELGHVLGMIRDNDSGNSAAAQANQRFNNDQIWRNCSGTIQSFSNAPH